MMKDDRRIGDRWLLLALPLSWVGICPRVIATNQQRGIMPITSRQYMEGERVTIAARIGTTG